MTARCPFCGRLFEVDGGESMRKVVNEHLLNDTTCGEALMRRIVEGNDEQKQTR